MDKSELLIHQLFQTVRIISKGLNKSLEPYSLYSSEWSLITTLKAKGPMTQGALANYLNIEPPAVSRSLVNLEKKGFITRTLGVDKREKTVLLSESALEQYPTWLEVSGHHRHAILANVSSEQLTELTLLLKTIFQSAQQYEQTS
jgi:MarR family transcriptional regulator, transcriptional regulator for hemolysin